MNFRGYQIPEALVRITGGGPETFEAISDSHMAIIQKAIGIKSNHTFLEVGCGIGRDAIPLTEKLIQGRYIGVDIIQASIEWCKQNITPKHPNFIFHHFNIKDQLHNPSGCLKTTDIRLPLEDSSVDRIILFSVFTHMYTDDILHYLKEFQRVLKPEGLIYATAFVFNDEILKSAWEKLPSESNLRFEHELSPDCRVSDPRFPLGAIAYTHNVFDSLVKASGLKFVRYLAGGWSGYYDQPDDGQDAIILARYNY